MYPKMKDALIGVFTTLFGLLGIASFIIFIWNLVSFINIYLFIGSIVALVVVILTMTIEDLYKESRYYLRKTAQSAKKETESED
jgi:uncharacterized membrane protein